MGQSRIVRSVLKFTNIEFKVKNLPLFASNNMLRETATTGNQSEGDDYPSKGMYVSTDTFKLLNSSHTVYCYSKLGGKDMLLQNLP